MIEKKTYLNDDNIISSKPYSVEQDLVTHLALEVRVQLDVDGVVGAVEDLEAKAAHEDEQ